MKKFILPLIIIIALTGCNVLSKNSDDQKDTSKDSSSLITDSIIKTNTNIVCTSPVEKKVYLTHEEWQNAVENTDNATVKDISSEFDENFFKDYALCYLPVLASGGMEYKLKDVSISNADKNTLTVNTTYSEKKILNNQVCYEFFISLDKDQLGSIDNIELSEKCRD